MVCQKSKLNRETPDCVGEPSCASVVEVLESWHVDSLGSEEFSRCVVRSKFVVLLHRRTTSFKAEEQNVPCVNAEENRGQTKNEERHAEATISHSLNAQDEIVKHRS